MIAVSVPPNHPFGLSHSSKNRMRLKVCSALHVGKLLNRLFQCLPILFKFQGRGAADFLIHFRSGFDATRPGERSVQRHPFHHRTRKNIALAGNFFAAHHADKGIGQVTDHLMRQVKRGRVITSHELRSALATYHETDLACPLTTGIFGWIAAHAAEEAEEQGERRPTPWWRTLKAGGELNPKYPGGLERQRTLLESEGHRVIARGKRLFVEGFEKRLDRLEPSMLSGCLAEAIAPTPAWRSS